MSGSLPFRTVLFDVDGTLIDSNGAHANAWALALLEQGLPVSVEQVRPLIGMGGDKLLPAAAGIDESSARGKAITARKREIFAETLSTLQPTRGARALVEYAREHGAALVVATSAGEDEMDALLRQAGVDDLIPRRTSKDDAEESKPDPDIVQAALARVRARPEESILVGDTPYDIEAATRAGIGTIALRCGGHWSDRDLAGAIEIFDDPAALLEHWRGPKVVLSTIVT